MKRDVQIVKLFQMQDHSTKYFDNEIMSSYDLLKKEINDVAASGDKNRTMQLVAELWIMMNRFRNCDLQFYFDEDLTTTVQSLNGKAKYAHSYDSGKANFRICYIFNPSDTGGASIPHRFMLDDAFTREGVHFQHFVLIPNPFNREYRIEDSEQLQYLHKKKKISGMEVISAGLTWEERGERIEQWLRENQIDFVLYDPDPSVLYALASNPCAVTGVLNQDCYTYSLGQGSGDLTFLVTEDQFFKYKFRDPAYYDKLKIVMLPLHPGDVAETAEPIDLSEFGVLDSPEVTVSATTNMWKCNFGDSEFFLESLAELLRNNSGHHHLFAGTPRSLDQVDVFLQRNPDLKGRIHYIGVVKNIYRLLKRLDFFINSFPTSGGSDLEMALLGKPTIEFTWNRNLTLHPVEFLRSRESVVTSKDDFLKLGTRFIRDPEYRHDLGKHLKEMISREFDQKRILPEKIYDAFLEEYWKKAQNTKEKSAVEIMSLDLEYEKCIGLYNSYGVTHWNREKKLEWLSQGIELAPEKPFAWIKRLELCLEDSNQEEFNNIISEMPERLHSDYRVLALMMLCQEALGQLDTAIETGSRMVGLSDYLEISKHLYAKMLHRNQRMDPLKEFLMSRGEIQVEGELEAYITSLPEYSLPYFYNY